MKNRVFYYFCWENAIFQNFRILNVGLKWVLDDLQTCLGYEKISTESREFKNRKNKFLSYSKTCLKWVRKLVKKRIFLHFWKTFFKFWRFYKRLCKMIKNGPNFWKLQNISYLLVVFKFSVTQKTKILEGGQSNTLACFVVTYSNFLCSLLDKSI